MSGGLRACKTAMMEGGVIKSDAVRHPLEPLPPGGRTKLSRKAWDPDLIALRWGK
jgi:4-hydroxy-tetrahydrodipicolinate synthase